MKYKLIFVVFFTLFNCLAFAQIDSVSLEEKIDNISSVNSKTKKISIDLTNPEDVEFALKKIHTLKFLESIILGGVVEESDLRKIFYRLSGSKNLTSITLRENDLDKIPDNISSLKTLQSVTIEGNNDLDYNDLCARLKNISITQLNLIDNDLKKTPINISEIVSLNKIQISGSSQLDYIDFVDQLAQLPRLTTLSIPVNFISDLPKNIGKLKLLQILDVSNNTFTELPQEISSLKAINNLSIQGNLLLNPARDLEKLKGNNIQYLSLDKEISGEELEQIKKIFPDAQIDFPINPKEDESLPEDKKNVDISSAPKKVFIGELNAKKEYEILSSAYLSYATLFQGLIYNFDTLNFEERYQDLRYANVYQRVSNNIWRAGNISFRKYLLPYEKSGKKDETWFRFSMEDRTTQLNYPELRAFDRMYWVYKGELTKKEFEKKYLIKRQLTTHIFGIKWKSKVRVIWNDIRITFDNNNSLFTIQVKSDNGFDKFSAYPVVSDLTIEKCQEMYYKRFQIYQKTLLKRAQRFRSDQAKNKTRYNPNFYSMKEFAWKELQLRMSDEEKQMTREQWLEYYDDIIAHEQKAIDNSSLSMLYVLRAITLRGYNQRANFNFTNGARRNIQINNVASGFSFKTLNVDFVDAKSNGKLAIANICIINNKDKYSSQTRGTLGLSPNSVTIQQFSSYSIIVELRNGDLGLVTSEEIDKQIFDPQKIFQFKVLVFDKNLDTIKNLLKDSGVN